MCRWVVAYLPQWTRLNATPGILTPKHTSLLRLVHGKLWRERQFLREDHKSSAERVELWAELQRVSLSCDRFLAALATVPCWLLPALLELFASNVGDKYRSVGHNHDLKTPIPPLCVEKLHFSSRFLSTPFEMKESRKVCIRLLSGPYRKI